MRSIVGTIALVAGSCIASTAAAQVADFSTFRLVYYVQNDPDTQPVTEDSAALFLNLRTTNPDDALNVNVTLPFQTTPIGIPEVTPTIYQYFSGYYPTQAALQGDYPAGEYYFTIDGGTLGDDNGAIWVPEPLYPEQIPYFTFDTLTNLNGMDTSADFYGTINGYLPVPEADENLIFVAVYLACGGGDQLGGFYADPTTTQFVIPAGTLSPGRQYVIAAFYSARRYFTGGFASGASSYAAFDRSTQAVFNTGYNGCLADLTAEGTVDFGDFLAFFNAYDTSDTPADLDGCNGVDFADFLLFFNAYDLGCGEG
jgi:hypothetical protein